MKQLPVGWTIHLRDPEAKKNFEGALRGSTLVFDRLRSILEDRLEELCATECTDEFYESVNLDQRFYKNQGRKKELRELLRLLAF